MAREDLVNFLLWKFEILYGYYESVATVISFNTT
jgi:hypothetical protein